MAVKVLQSGSTTREPLPGLLAQARAYTLVRNEMQAQAALDQIAASNDVNSDLSMVKDVLSALALYQ